MYFNTTKLILSTTLVAAAVMATGCDIDMVGPLILQSTDETQEAYTELSKDWVRWALGQPYSTGPITDQTGAACTNDQQGKVWFLAGTSGGFADRDCTVPAGKALFFPLINLWVVPNADRTDTPEEVAGYLSWVPNYFESQREATCQLTLRVDGEDILPDLESLDAELYVSVLDAFDLDLNDDNWASVQFGKPGGYIPVAWAHGHWALLEPLPPGDHVLELGGAICDKKKVTFETGVTYNLHVGD